MLIFRMIADIALIAGTLLVVWELLAAAKTLTIPPRDNTQNILKAIERLYQLTNKMSSQLSEVYPGESDDDSSHEMQ